MKIQYTPNPLNTIIMLNEHESQILWYKLKVEELHDLIAQANFDLSEEHRAWYNEAIKPRSLEEAVEQAQKSLDLSYLFGEGKWSKEGGLDSTVTEMHAHYLEELTRDHCGDCTCFAASCSKCRAEELVGIDTLKGLSKHCASMIKSAFSAGLGPDGKHLPERSLEEVLERLSVYEPVKGPSWDRFSDEEFLKYVPKWKATAAAALEWLQSYKRTYLENNHV